MKRLIFVICYLVSVVCAQTIAFAQSTNDLDIKNGFKEFKIGDDFSKWQPFLEYEGSGTDESKSYVYTGTCCNMVFQYPVEKIKLMFKDNKVVLIHIMLKKFQEEFAISGKYTEYRNVDYMNIKNSFQALFGEPTGLDRPKGYDHVSYIWAGNKITLVSRYEDLGVMNGDRLFINIYSNSYSKEKLQNGF